MRILDSENHEYEVLRSEYLFHTMRDGENIAIDSILLDGIEHVRHPVFRAMISGRVLADNFKEVLNDY